MCVHKGGGGVKRVTLGLGLGGGLLPRWGIEVGGGVSHQLQPLFVTSTSVNYLETPENSGLCRGRGAKTSL